MPSKENEQLQILRDKTWPGTKATGFVTKKESPPPRECGKCEYFKPNSCGEEHVMADPELQSRKMSDGRIVVATGDCCNYFEPQEKK